MKHRLPDAAAAGRSIAAVTLLIAMATLLAGCSRDRDNDRLTEETVRQIVREESGGASPEMIRQIAREEIVRALAAEEEAATADCDIDTAATRALPSVVQIETRVPGTAVIQSTGSGFVALAGGIIVTAAHVVKDAPRVDVITADGRRIIAEVLKRDTTLDLAALRASDRTLSPIAWADPSAIALGEQVRIIGYPGNSGITVTGGVLASRETSPPAVRETLITDANADLGNSGGPLVTRCGEALGVVVERQPFVSTVSTVSVGAGTALPFVLSATAASPAGDRRTVTPTPTTSPSPTPLPRSTGTPQRGNAP